MVPQRAYLLSSGQAEKPPDVAAVPNDRSDAEPEDVTGTIVQSPGAAIPVDIGESSSAELPVIPHQERPPVITPARAKVRHESRATPELTTPQAKKTVRYRRRARPATPKQQTAAQPNLLDALFGTGGGPNSSAQRSFTAQ